MYGRRELCRNFQRGSCQFGERCKFIHPAQQAKPNPFGFGTREVYSQQQKPNPFGFGVQNNSQSRNSNVFGNKPNQLKAFENKWIRQPDSQQQSAEHKCIDPEECKRIIVEDFKNERPLWKLTCYGHSQYVPCDISGDISYEELRVMAYDDAKRGSSMQSIVEKERNLLNSKLVEFERLLQNPYKGSANSASLNQGILSGSSQGGIAPVIQNNASQMVPGLGHNVQPQSSYFESRPSAQSNLFGLPNPSANSGDSKNAGIGISSPTDSIFRGFQSEGLRAGSSYPSNTAGFNNGSNANNFQRNSLNVPVPSPFGSSARMPLMDLNASVAPNVAEKENGNVQLGVNLQNQDASGDMSVWLKQKWSPGEIPEEAPPDSVI